MHHKELNKLFSGYLKKKLTYKELVDSLPVVCHHRFFGSSNGSICTLVK